MNKYFKFNTISAYLNTVRFRFIENKFRESKYYMFV